MADTYTSARIEDLNPDTPSNAESIGTAAIAIRQIKKCLTSEAAGGLQDKIDTAAQKAVMDRDYEQGDIFITEKETDPSDLFGGTWQKLDAGQVIISKGTGSTPSVDYTPLFIVKTWKTDTTWGRIYSDGWCEQGGMVNNLGDNARTVITLERAFTTPVNVQASCNTAGHGTDTDAGYVGITFEDNTKISIKLGRKTSGDADVVRIYWKALGYVNLNTDKSTTKLSLLYLNTWKKVSD